MRSRIRCLATVGFAEINSNDREIANPWILLHQFSKHNDTTLLEQIIPTQIFVGPK